MQDRNTCIRPTEDPINPSEQSKKLAARRKRRSQPLKLVVQLMQYCRYYAAALGYEKPLGVEGPESKAMCADTVFLVIPFGI